VRIILKVILPGFVSLNLLCYIQIFRDKCSTFDRIFTGRFDPSVERNFIERAYIRRFEFIIFGLINFFMHYRTISTLKRPDDGSPVGDRPSHF